MAGTITIEKIDGGPRSARASISYRPKNAAAAIASADIDKHIESFSFTDVACSESDSMSVTLTNIGLVWASKWIPSKGDTLFASIIVDNWVTEGVRNTISLGRFCCDDRIFNFPDNATAVINGVSVPENHSFRSTPRTKTWEKITIQEISKRIASRYGMELRYFGGNIKISKAEQSDADDCSFLDSLCKKYGLYMKVYNGRVVIYKIREFELKDAVSTIDYSEVLSGEYNSTLTGTYTGARIKYTVKVGKETKDKALTIGTWDRMLIVNEKADNYGDAYTRVWAKVREENRKSETLKITVAAAGRPLWAATSINLTNAEFMSGKWFIDKATHTIGASDGYTIALEMHRVRF